MTRHLRDLCDHFQIAPVFLSDGELDANETAYKLLNAANRRAAEAMASLDRSTRQRLGELTKQYKSDAAEILDAEKRGW